MSTNRHGQDSRRFRTIVREMLERADGRLGLNAPEDAEVRALCERLGYGAVMDAAARLWQRKDPVGAFMVGPCVWTARKAVEGPRQTATE